MDCNTGVYGKGAAQRDPSDEVIVMDACGGLGFASNPPYACYACCRTVEPT